MGHLKFTNVVGREVEIHHLKINKEDIYIEETKIPEGSTNSIKYDATDADQFDRMILTIRIDYGKNEHQDYEVNLNRDHWFADNNGSYPGGDFDINLILMGFDNHNMKMMQVYRDDVTGGTFSFCSDTKELSPK